MDKLTLGILAHVDAGKTTLSEALLYTGGALRKLGRVDHADAFLDTETLERERGITIFSKQAVLPLEDLELTLMDTPGHADFAAEAERVLGVLDCALLVVSAPDGPQGHTLTLWRLLERHGVPTFLFLNKMDQPGVDREKLLQTLRTALGGTILDLADYGKDSFWEEAALGDEEALEEYMASGALSDGTLRRLMGERKLFPCLFGSALKLEGVEELLSALTRFAPRPQRGEEFGARVFKIARDPSGTRLTHIKVTGGSLKVKSVLPETGEKVDQIRVYSGSKFAAPDQVSPGTVCALVGPAATYPGQALGAEGTWAPPTLEPALSYQMILPEGADPHGVLPRLRELTEEDPQLHLEWNESLGEIHVRLMGQVQAEILQRLIADRFGLQVEFGPGSIVYRETIAGAVEGVGHYEPLRHYAEVHLLLEPLPLGSGVEIATACSEDDLPGSWQRLIFTHLAEKAHRGTLTGSTVTDIRFTLLSGAFSVKHTEGGDFRQATYRAVRQGLRKAQNVLLEPWYDFRLEVPTVNLGRALSDVQRMGGEAGEPRTVGEETVVTGSAPVSKMGDYAAEVAAYTRGMGRLTCTAGGYRPCGDQEAVVEALGYDPDRDPEDSCGSIFCAHGAGFYVPWDQVDGMAHLPLLDMEKEEEDVPDTPAPAPRRTSPPTSLTADRELMDIFQRTYGEIKPRSFQPTVKPRPTLDRKEWTVPDRGKEPEYLLVDGYNMIFAWEDLQARAQKDLDDARRTLADLLCDYQALKKNRVILVFDAYKVPKGVGSVSKYHNIHLVYTKEAETADAYIEKASYKLTKEGRRVYVASSDAAEQFIILGHGALRISAAELRAEMEAARKEAQAILKKNNLRLPAGDIRAAFERAGGWQSGEEQDGQREETP